MGNWNIQIKASFLGFAPAYWANSYPTYGKANQAGGMTDVSLIDPTKLTQGPGLAALTNGTQAAAVTELINYILGTPSASDTTWGIGATKLFKISSTSVTSGGSPSWPQAITNCIDGESVVYYNGNVYGFYNKSSGGDILKMPTSTETIDPDWGSTVPTGAEALASAPHPSVLGGDGIIYFGNDNSVGYYDASANTLSATELDLPLDCQVADLVWEKSLLFIATNAPNIATGNSNRGVIYTWDTTSDSFQEPVIEVPGKIGSLFLKNGLIFVFYQDLSSTGSFKLGYINGDIISDLASFSGTLPLFGQSCHFENHIAFISNAQIFLWGAIDAKIPVALTQYADGGYSTVGALSNPFGTPMVASNQSTSYQLAKFSGLSVLSAWNTINYDIATSVIDKVVVFYEPTSSGARVDLTLRYNRASTLSIGTISHTNDSAVIRKTFYPKQECDDFRLELSWANGSATNALSIRKIVIYGHSVEKD